LLLSSDLWEGGSWGFISSINISLLLILSQRNTLIRFTVVLDMCIYYHLAQSFTLVSCATAAFLPLAPQYSQSVRFETTLQGILPPFVLADLKKESGGKERKRVSLALSLCNHKSQEVEWQCIALVLLLNGRSLTHSPAGCIQSCYPAVRENSTGAGAAPVAAVVAEVAVAAA